MSKILVINMSSLTNKGTEGVVVGAIKCIEAGMPQDDITFLCQHYESDMVRLSKISKGAPKIQVKRHPWYREVNVNRVNPLVAIYLGIQCLLSLFYCALCRLACECGLSPKNVFNECDLILDLNIDLLNDFYKGIFPPVFVLSNILHGIVAGKPVVVCAASIASFRTRSLRFLARTVLNKTKMIMIRDEFSREHLRNLGVDKPKVVLTADLAFLLEPCSTERLEEIWEQQNISGCKRPLIGVAVAHKSLFAKPEWYIQLIAELSDRLIQELDATLIYIPYSFQAGPRDDDDSTIQEIYQRIGAKHKVRLIQEDYTADELKGITGRCDFFVSAKFHPLLASISMAIPSIGIVGYNQYKFYGVIGKMMGQEEYLINIEDFNDYEALRGVLETKVRHAWENQDSIRKRLTEKGRVAKEQALLNGTLIQDLK